MTQWLARVVTGTQSRTQSMVRMLKSLSAPSYIQIVESSLADPEPPGPDNREIWASVTPAQRDKLAAVAARTGTSMTAVIRAMLESWPEEAAPDGEPTRPTAVVERPDPSDDEETPGPRTVPPASPEPPRSKQLSFSDIET